MKKHLLKVQVKDINGNEDVRADSFPEKNPKELERDVIVKLAISDEGEGYLIRIIGDMIYGEFLDYSKSPEGVNIAYVYCDVVTPEEFLSSIPKELAKKYQLSWFENIDAVTVKVDTVNGAKYFVVSSCCVNTIKKPSRYYNDDLYAAGISKEKILDLIYGIFDSRQVSDEYTSFEPYKK